MRLKCGLSVFPGDNDGGAVGYSAKFAPSCGHYVRVVDSAGSASAGGLAMPCSSLPDYTSLLAPTQARTHPINSLA
ncbi:hypothetical protein BaRGS_00026911 [Batillaria attramentaria]|uniref:Uncharacterized protein n=1 Tax=Batillaria attramentaria TaxID=370345 RepID=A0ABD0K4Q4_9CAEN